MERPISFEIIGIHARNYISVSHVTRGASDPSPDRFAHLHQACELVVFEQVNGQLTTEIGTYTLSGRCAVLLPPMAIHDFALQAGASSWVLVQHHFEDLHPRALTAPLTARLDDVAFDRLQALLGWLEEVSETGQLDQVRAILALIGSAIADAPPLPSRLRTTDTALHKLAPFFAHISATDTPICSLSDAAALCRMSPSYFSRIFSRTLGMTFAQYMVEHRLKRAAIALLTTHTQIKAISHSNGFHQTAYFSSLFRKRYGATPSQFRARGRSDVGKAEDVS